MSPLRWSVVCAPGDPSAAAWSTAASALGIAMPRIVPWAQVLDGTASFDEGELVHAERLTPVVPTKYGGSRARYEHLAFALDKLKELIAAGNAKAALDTESALIALDRKRRTGHLAAAGEPLPAAGDLVLRQRFAEPGDAVSTSHGHGMWTTLAAVRSVASATLVIHLHGHSVHAALTPP